MKQLHVLQLLRSNPETPLQTDIRYKVKKIVNSTVPEIDSELDPVGLNAYCESADWTVTVT